VLLAQYVVLSGSVTDPQGELVVGASVHLERGGAEVLRAKSDGRGQFTLYDISLGNITLRAEAPGFAPIAREISIPISQTREANLQFERLSTQSQSIVITTKSLEPAIDMRNAEVFNRTLFSRDDQVFQQLNAGINAGQHEGGGKSLDIRRFEGAESGTDPGSHNY
jgi:Carboxypeptidase regulatory-like domain